MTPADFPWRTGMLAYPRGRGTPFRILALRPATDRKPAIAFLVRPPLTVGTWEPVDSLYDADLTDGPTKGALLEAVREVWGAPLAQVTPWIRWDGATNVCCGWRCCLNDAADARFPADEHAPTEGAALLAAWKARPR